MPVDHLIILMIASHVAYCTSIHKSQGSEFPIVIMPIVKQYFRMLQRPILQYACVNSSKSWRVNVISLPSKSTTKTSLFKAFSLEVLQLVNRPNDNIFNGDIGVIVGIFWAKENALNKDVLVVDFEGTL
jgi:hypothetical protein